MKQSNDCGAKELAVMRSGEEETSSAHRGGFGMSTQSSPLTLISQIAKRESRCKFTSLMHLLTDRFFRRCFYELKRDKAIGIDGVSVEDYEANLFRNTKELYSKLRSWKYKPKPVRRVYIPKPDGNKRGLGILCIEDKIVQIAIKKILEVIFEADFTEMSYGFRTGQSCHDALDRLDKIIMTKPINYIVDMDIEKFFDTINHEWLMKCLQVRIADKNFLRLIRRFLNSGIMEAGKHIEVERGTVQGSIISPILANVYLHYILDLWFEKRVKTYIKGYGSLIRYADDFIICFQSEKEAKEISRALRNRLEKFELKIPEKKSRIIEFGRYAWKRAETENRKLEVFNFLGFTHYCDKTRSGKFKLGRKTSASRFQMKLREINKWLKEIRNTVNLLEWWKILGMKLNGHYRYFGISGNMRAIKAFGREVSKLAYKWINRRSQKKSFTYKQYCKFVECYPLPKPKIYHLLYTLSVNKGCITEEPNLGNLDVRFCEGH